MPAHDPTTRLRTAREQRLTGGTYHGGLAGLAPIDAGLALAARRSRTAFRLWHAYNELTSPLFDLPQTPERSADPACVADLRMFYRIARGGIGNAYFDEATHARFDRSAVPLEAPTNTLIHFDNRGLHASSFCTEVRRVILVNGYRPQTSLRLNPRLFRALEKTPLPWHRPGQPSGSTLVAAG